MLSGTLAPALGQSGSGSEYAVKAAFLFHFAQFVEWPAEAFKDSSSPITYCTMGDDPFHGSLDQALSGKTVGIHPLRVEHLREFEKAQGCQVLFLSAGEKKRITEALADVSRLPILTVGETEHFVQEGGVIGFCLEENKIRFEINLDAASKVNLKISAKLLALAKTVVGSARGN
jgi:YfiR/HmsC-like